MFTKDQEKERTEARVISCATMPDRARDLIEKAASHEEISSYWIDWGPQCDGMHGHSY